MRQREVGGLVENTGFPRFEKTTCSFLWVDRCRVMMDVYVIDRYDLVEVIEVPAKYADVMNVGDVGVVLEKHDGHIFDVECIEPGGTHKWLAKLHVEHIRLKSRDPFSRWEKASLTDPSIMRPSIQLGSRIGGIVGALMGIGLGAITQNINGILLGFAIGLIFGVVNGILTAVVTVKAAGLTGGVGVGYFAGMLFGGIFGMIVGALIPTALRLRAATEGLPILDALVMGRFDTAVLISFTFSILDTIVGVWISGKNQIPRNLKERYRP